MFTVGYSPASKGYNKTIIRQREFHALQDNCRYSRLRTFIMDTFFDVWSHLGKEKSDDKDHSYFRVGVYYHYSGV